MHFYAFIHSFFIYCFIIYTAYLFYQDVDATDVPVINVSSCLCLLYAMFVLWCSNVYYVPRPSFSVGTMQFM